ncbi:MAG: matrixin family metalloprotease, partial [Planctomycetota bacterium]
IAVFDNLFNEANAGTPDLTNRGWFALIQQALDRWGEVSGVEYIYEPNDDGVTNFNFGGIVGVRGDVRIGGFNIDGPGDTLAFNSFPNVGDMAIDTSDTGTYGNAFASFRLFRNVFTHEQGHGLGFAHVESNSAGFLMEPFIQSGFDGPQLDDVRAVQRQYGDIYEKSNGFQGNDTIANATFLGSLDDGDTVAIGLDAEFGTAVGINEVDFISIDDNLDTDFLRFTVNEIGFLDLTLTPVGQPYNESPQGGGGGNFTDPSASSNLTLALFSSSGSIIDIVNNTGAGSPEEILGSFVSPGDYLIRVTGSANTVQLYTIEATLDGLELPTATAPTNLVVQTGVAASGDVSELLNADNQYLDLNPAIPGSVDDAPLATQFLFFAPDVLPTEFSVAYEGSGNTPNLNQTLTVFSNTSGQFVELDSRSVPLSDANFTIVPAGDAQQYVSFPSGLVLVEAQYEPTGPVLMYPWTIRIDRLVINTLD